MHLVQLLLPLFDNAGEHFPQAPYRQVRAELTERFGGLTETSHDEIVVFEVMAERLDRAWWAAYRGELEQRFRQDVVVIRAQAIERL
jgi:hypothetical protein